MAEHTLTFQTSIGVEVKGDLWTCVETPGSVDFLGTGRSVRVDARIDDVDLPDVGAMPTGAGGLVISLNASVRKRLGKGLGDPVSVSVTRR